MNNNLLDIPKDMKADKLLTIMCGLIQTTAKAHADWTHLNASKAKPATPKPAAESVAAKQDAAAEGPQTTLEDDDIPF